MGVLDIMGRCRMENVTRLYPQGMCTFLVACCTSSIYRIAFQIPEF